MGVQAPPTKIGKGILDSAGTQAHGGSAVGKAGIRGFCPGRPDAEVVWPGRAGSRVVRAADVYLASPNLILGTLLVVIRQKVCPKRI
jgi:hypothetical protein